MKRLLRGIVVCAGLLMLPALALSQEGFDPDKVKLGSSSPYFNSGAFQSGLWSAKNLGELATKNSPVREKEAAFGFSAKSEEAKFFIIGALYSEAIACLNSGDRDLASKRLQLIEREFINMGAPSSLYGYVSKTRNMLETENYPPEYMVTVLSFFGPFFEDYAKGKSEEKLTLFRAGSWLVNMGLAAAAGDKVLLKQPDTLNYFTTQMKKMDAPKGVLDALGEIQKVAQKEQITDKDSEHVLELIKEIENLLG